MANSSPQKVIVNDRAAKRLRQGHVWVYASDVLNDTGTQPGALVHVIGPRDKALGSAIYSSSSQIKLRLLGSSILSVRRRPAGTCCGNGWQMLSSTGRGWCPIPMPAAWFLVKQTGCRD